MLNIELFCFLKKTPGFTEVIQPSFFTMQSLDGKVNFYS